MLLARRWRRRRRRRRRRRVGGSVNGGGGVVVVLRAGRWGRWGAAMAARRIPCVLLSLSSRFVSLCRRGGTTACCRSHQVSWHGCSATARCKATLCTNPWPLLVVFWCWFGGMEGLGGAATASTRRARKNKIKIFGLSSVFPRVGGGIILFFGAQVRVILSPTIHFVANCL